MAIISESLILVWTHLPAVLITLFVLHFSRNYFTPGAVSVPGPLLAKITNVWRFINVAKGRAEVTLYNLHKRHGDYVRLGPNVISVRNLDVLKTIYGINKGYQKVNSMLKNGPTFPLTFERQISIVFSNSSPKAGQHLHYSQQQMKNFMPLSRGLFHQLTQ
jgi:hypothetical protein